MIRIHNLWKSYQKNTVLRGLTLTIERGETLVILGRSGVGKSVLLKQIIGIEEADQGYVKINGTMISELRGKKRYAAKLDMGMLFQRSALFDSMSIEENVAFYLSQHGNRHTGKKYSKKEIRERVDHALNMVGLSGIQKSMPSDLSGGMQKRAGLARLIVYQPQLLLYDEPTSEVDPMTAMQINELIIKTQQQLKTTSVVVTHDIISALSVGDRLALQREGHIVYIDTPDAFMRIDDPDIIFLNKMITQDPRSLRKRVT